MEETCHLTLEALPARTVPRPFSGGMNAVIFRLNSVILPDKPFGLI